MKQKIPVPASSVQSVAESASENIVSYKESGYDSTARRLEQAVEDVEQSTSNADGGEFVSVPSLAVSAITADSTCTECEVTRHFLVQYDVWEGRHID